MSSVWPVVLGGAAVGAVVSALSAAVMTMFGWRRENRYRFAAQRREVYLDYLDALRERSSALSGRNRAEGKYEESPKDPALLEAWQTAKERHRQAVSKLMHTGQALRIIGSRDVVRAAARLQHAQFADDFLEDDYDDALDLYVAAARQDLDAEPVPPRSMLGDDDA